MSEEKDKEIQTEHLWYKLGVCGESGLGEALKRFNKALWEFNNAARALADLDVKVQIDTARWGKR